MSSAKSIRLAAASLSIFALSLVSDAAPFGPVVPRKNTFRLGVEVARDERDYEMTQNRGVERKLHSQNFLTRGVVGLSDRYEVSLSLGGSTVDLNDLLSANSADNRSGQATIGVGVGAIVARDFLSGWGMPVDLAAQAGYLGHHSHTRRIAGTENADADFDEWGAGLQLQGRYKEYLPYFGIKYSLAEYAVPGGFDAEGDDHVGAVMGTGFTINRHWNGYVETRLLDETSFGGGVFYTF